jgi:hypothetical protein
MTSFRQMAANRRNALKSTGPVTPEGKERSRGNALRHGLTAETVIAAIEDEDDYRAFEAAVIADYDAETAVQRELALRLASVLWRLRRATGIETALFESAYEDKNGPKRPDKNIVVVDSKRPSLRAIHNTGVIELNGPDLDPKRNIAACFTRLADLPSYALDRLSRYEYTLWRQARQIIFALESPSRRSRKPNRSRFPF